jgi:hypothetical protein
MSADIPPVAAVIIHELEDYDAWKPKFDAHADARKAGGILGHHLNRGADNANLVAAYFPHTDVDQLKTFLSNDELRAAMKDAGVKGTPDIKIMKVRSADLDLSKPLAGMIVSHSVKNYDQWRAAYDSFDDKRKAMGITGHAVNTLYDDDQTVIAYHQAESMDTLKAFMASDELKSRMAEAGVTSPPQATFWTSEVGAEY